MAQLLEWVRDGGPAALAITAVALAGGAVVAERFFVVIVRAQAHGRPLIEQVIQLARAGRTDDAIKLCARTKSILPDVGLLILRSRSRDETDLRDVAEAAALSMLPQLTRRLPYLPTLAVVALLLGVLGAATGTRRTLMLAAAVEPAERASRLMDGLAASLGQLTVAIVVAVSLLLAHAVLAAQAEVTVARVREFSVRLINAMLDRPDVRLGHR